MKRMLMLLIIVLPYFMQAQTQSFPELKGEYLGQKPPKDIPEVFAPGIVSDTSWAEHCQLAISPKGDEIYWSAWSSKYPPKDTRYKGNSEQIYFSKLQKGKWTKPALAEFVKEHILYLNGGPAFSPDGNRLFFYSSGRPGGLGKKDLWYVERENNGWSKAINVGRPFNSERNDDWTPLFLKNGNAYHMGNYSDDKNERPLVFKYEDAKFANPDTLDIHPDFKPYWAMCVSQDESYLIFAGVHPEGYGGLDLYICFKDAQGNWGYPVNMGDKINSSSWERFPMVSPDGKYLFFVRHTETQDFYWVSTDVIEKLKKKNVN